MLAGMLVYLGAALGGVLIGALIAWALGRGRALGLLARLEERDAALWEARQALEAERTEHAGAREQAAALRARVAELSVLEERLPQALDGLARAALAENNTAFLQLARTHLEGFQSTAREDLSKRQQAIDLTVKPLAEALGRFESAVNAMEKQRGQAYGSLSQQLRALSEAHGKLERETSTLAQALRAPTVRGRWGEITLRRVVELAGMTAHCDFFEQSTVTTEAGRLQPDMVVRLPGGRSVVIDAKAPLGAYLDAQDAPDEATRQARLAELARQMRRLQGSSSRDRSRASGSKCLRSVVAIRESPSASASATIEASTKPRPRNQSARTSCRPRRRTSR